MSWAQFRLWLSNPPIAVLLAGLLVLDFGYLPTGAGEGGSSLIGVYLKRDVLGWTSAGARVYPFGGPLDGYFITDGSAVRATRPDDESWGETVAVLSKRPGG